MNFPAVHLPPHRHPPFPPYHIVMAFTQQLEITSDCPDTQITLAFLIPVNSCNQKVRTELDFQSNEIFIFILCLSLRCFCLIGWNTITYTRDVYPIAS